MSKHHHHPHEGHSAGTPNASKRPLHHTVFFYVAGLFLLVALLCFIFEGSFLGRPGIVSPQVSPAANVQK
jgi:hypothetical protein